ncbi:uncharacterized protein LOC143854857 [Tasmannia lanceolata]|uniref:uncharacterized protein LOC143854857 n=1 Tax=Tasmannia lanceolata TaxID=3420 RepID=UPI0040639C1E
MPGLQRQQVLNQDMVCQKSKKKSDFAEEAKNMRKIRVICHDPDATDSSSEDEDSKYKKTGLKRLICEIKLPVKSTPYNFERESFSQDSNNTKTKPRKRATKKATKSPSKNTVVLQKSKNSLSVSCFSQDSEPFFSLSSPSSVLDVSTPVSLINGLDNPMKGEIKPSKGTEPRSVFLEEPLMPLDFDSFMEDLGVLEEEGFVGLEDLPLYENDLSAMNFDLDVDSLAWLNL